MIDLAKRDRILRLLLISICSLCRSRGGGKENIDLRVEGMHWKEGKCLRSEGQGIKSVGNKFILYGYREECVVQYISRLVCGMPQAW